MFCGYDMYELWSVNFLQTMALVLLQVTSFHCPGAQLRCQHTSLRMARARVHSDSSRWRKDESYQSRSIRLLRYWSQAQSKHVSLMELPVREKLQDELVFSNVVNLHKAPALGKVVLLSYGPGDGGVLHQITLVFKLEPATRTGIWEQVQMFFSR